MSKVTPQMADWLLYNLPWLKAHVNSIEPKVSTSIVLFVPRSTVGSPIEDMAVRRAEISVVIDAVERGLRALHPDDRTVCRMKYRAHMTRREVARKAFLSESSVARKLTRIRDTIAQHVGQLEGNILTHFWSEIRAVS